MENENDSDDDDDVVVSTGTKMTTVKVLPNVVGVEGCANDVIACYGEQIAQHVILFPGDVQDYHVKMEKHRDNHMWKQYSLEATARFIFERFTNACVWVMKASQLHLNTFACYKNFVQSSTFGIPTYSKEKVIALLQTAHLLDECIRQEFSECLRKEISGKPISIIGFSKGCTVLNQMLHEWPLLHSTNERTVQEFTEKIKEFCWLDSGNCGQSGAWVTDESCFEEIVKSVRFRVHVTPYQVNDKFRPWIGEELNLFTNHLKTHNAKLKKIFHFEEEEPSLDNHFKLLLEFRDVNATS